MLHKLTSVTAVEDLLKKSGRVVIYKHSTACSLSMLAKDNILQFLDSHDVDIHMVHVIEDRPVSNFIESATGIRHESPQLLILDDGNVTAHESHMRISDDYLEDHLKATA